MDNAAPSATPSATCEVYDVVTLPGAIAVAVDDGDERRADQLTRIKGTTRPGGANDGKKYVYALFIGGELRNVESRSFIPYPPMRPDDGTPGWLAEAAERHLAALTASAGEPKGTPEGKAAPATEPVYVLAATSTYHWPGCGKAGAGVKLTLAQIAEATDGAGKPCGTCQPPALIGNGSAATGANEVAD